MKAFIAAYLEEHAAEFSALSDKIHQFAETAGEEYQSRDALCACLERHGFDVERGLGSQPTAFRAKRGDGGPRICFLAEYDALPELHQRAGIPYRDGNGGSGHGCGHNLLGTGAVAAALALQKSVERGGHQATVMVYGTPAEETLRGKTQLIADGYFADIDVALAWHPATRNHCGEYSHKAMHSARFSFEGVASHASVCPELGRSALDACELMNVAANYLREHVPGDVRFHYSHASPNGVPNIVPDHASLWYFVRAREGSTADEVLSRLIDIARGAALMTGTKASHEILASSRETIVNSALSRLAYENMRAYGAPNFDEDDRAYACALCERSGVATITGRLSEDIQAPSGQVLEEHGSTDFSNVSQLVPSLEINTTCFVEGTPGHHWAVTSASATPMARKGMLLAAKTLAATGLDIICDNRKLDEARVEFERRKAAGGASLHRVEGS